MPSAPSAMPAAAKCSACGSSSRSKTAEEALSLKTDELSGELGPLPPMKIHCAELVEGALRSALEENKPEPKPASAPQASSLLENFSHPEKSGARLVFLPPDEK